MRKRRRRSLMERKGLRLPSFPKRRKRKRKRKKRENQRGRRRELPAKKRKSLHSLKNNQSVQNKTDHQEEGEKIPIQVTLTLPHI